MAMVPPAPAVPKAKSWVMRIGVGLLVIGLAVGILCGVKVVLPFIDAFTSESITAPGRARLELEEGKYNVFELVSSSSRGDGFVPPDVTDKVRMLTSDIVVTDGSGNELSPYEVNDRTETITRGSKVYVASLGFEVDQPGTYTVEILEGPQAEVLVAREFGNTFESVAGWFFLGLCAGLAMVIGLTLVIIGFVRKGRRSANQMPPPHTQPWGGQAQ